MAAVTIRDVARQAGVGVGTVSRVLNDRESVSAATRQKVLTAIADLNFSPSQAARRLSRGKTMAIGVIVPYFTNPSVVRRLQGVVSVLSNSPYDLVLFDVEQAARRDAFLRKIRSGHLIDGLLIISLRLTDEEAGYLQEAQIPTVLVDAYHPAFSRVLVDNVSGGYQATRHLLDLGHCHIAHLGDYLDDPFNNPPVRDRYQGYRQALAEAGLPFRPEYHVQVAHGRFQAAHMTPSLLSLNHPPTAIFAYSDTQAIGIIEAAHHLGYRIPQDLSIIGFDDIEAAEFLNITTIRQHLYQSGVESSELLLQIIEQPLSEPWEVVLPLDLVVRQTTAVPTMPQTDYPTPVTPP